MSKKKSIRYKIKKGDKFIIFAYGENWKVKILWKGNKMLKWRARKWIFKTHTELTPIKYFRTIIQEKLS